VRTLKTRLYSLELAQEAKDMAFWPTGGQVVLPCSWASATLKVPRKTIAMPPTQRLMLTTNICYHFLQEAGIDDDDFYIHIILQLLACLFHVFILAVCFVLFDLYTRVLSVFFPTLCTKGSFWFIRRLRMVQLLQVVKPLSTLQCHILSALNTMSLRYLTSRLKVSLVSKMQMLS